MKKPGIRRRLEIMPPEGRDRILTRRALLKKLRLVLSGELLLVDLPLQFHERVQQRFGPRRTTGNVNIDRDITIDSFKHIVSLLEWSAGNRAGAHRDDVFWIGHLVVETDNLRRHFLCHRAGYNHQVGLTRGWPKDFAAEPGDVITRRGSGDHLDGATGEAKLQRPDRIFPAPIVEILHLRDPDALSLKFVA